MRLVVFTPHNAFVPEHVKNRLTTWWYAIAGVTEMPRALFTATVMNDLAQFHGLPIALLREDEWHADAQVDRPTSQSHDAPRCTDVVVLDVSLASHPASNRRCLHPSVLFSRRTGDRRASIAPRTSCPPLVGNDTRYFGRGALRIKETLGLHAPACDPSNVARLKHDDRVSGQSCSTAFVASELARGACL